MFYLGLIILIIILVIFRYEIFSKDRYDNYLKLVDVRYENEVKENNTFDDYWDYLKKGNYLSLSNWYKYPDILFIDKDTGRILKIEYRGGYKPDYVITELTYNECKQHLSDLKNRIGRSKSKKRKYEMSRGMVKQMLKKDSDTI